MKIPRFSLILLVSLILACSQRIEDRPLVMIQKADGEALTVKVEIADTEAERAMGLMFRRNLPMGEGMLFVFPEETRTSFWMKNTPLPLDMIFIRDHHIVEIFPNAVPFSEALITPSVNYDAVLEVPGGYASGEKLGEGDRVSYGNSP